MSVRWRVETVDKWVLSSSDADFQIADEPLGTKEKFWVEAPDGYRYLFKYARVHDDRVMGEDWVEWAVHELATLLSIPTAIAIPAVHNGRRGVLSRSVSPSGDRLIHGNELLAGVDPDYDSQIARKNPRYTVEAVRTALDGVAAPASSSQPIRTAFDAWAGYLMLDAWVAGRDRHHENWAAIEHGSELRLAPSFDHGNALGFQVPEDEVRTLAADEVRLARWAKRGRSHHFCDKPSLVSLADAALHLAGNEVRAYWLEKLASISTDDIESVIDAVSPEYLSDAGRTFRKQLLCLNRERIIHGD
ncbi:MAG: hypothetical protein GX610_00535 [Rhodococcus sp.]|nr:hypothetical protein [Rhodococcus sp. (in: high G+C Gram-positive bacteria)]